MVYWFLGSLVSASLQVLLEKLTNGGISVYKSIGDVDGKLKKLERTLKRVQFLIREAEDKQLLSDMNWKDLLRDLEEVAYIADDLIDEIEIKVFKLEGTQDQVRKLLLSFYKRTSAPNINDIQDRLDNLLLEVGALLQNRCRNVIESDLQTSSIVDESRVFGREIDKCNVINMILASSSKESSKQGNGVVVIPIVGMAGVGKTTLAQLVYNHDYPGTKKLLNFLPFSGKKAHFDLKMWVSVSEDFDVVRLTRRIIDEASNGENTCEVLSLNSLQVKLKAIVRDKKFLLVFDDLRNEKPNEWDRLLIPLKYGLNGSKIVITTRSFGVSKLVSAAQPYHLQCLLSEDCWSVLKEEALGNTDLDTVPELKEIGINIAVKCKGLPLAAKTVGRLLHSIGVDENEWNKILENKIWDLVVSELRTGYHPLPAHVRQCFAYCSLFPQNYEFEKDKTVQMWMGEGFLVPGEERKIIEDMGNDNFDHLWQKSFFQMVGGKYYMHDAVRQLAQSVSGNKFIRMERTNDSCIHETTRHLSLACEIIQTTTCEASYICKALRTFLLSGKYRPPIKEVPNDLFLRLVRLRVLDLSGTHIEELTGSIGNLKHLRFLDLSNTLLKWLPETVKELCILQTLRLQNCLMLLYLPKSTGRLKSLQHLELGGSSKLTSMPPGIGKLTGLQTVREFVVGSERGQLMELKDMNNIRGSLCIKQLEKVNNPEEAMGAKLADKEYLDVLDLQWTSTADARNNKHILDKLRPHETLKIFSLRRYGGKMFPAWGSTLETLEFSEMPRLESWVGIRDNDMASLRELTISECPKMVTLPSLHYLRSLKKLEFDNCPQLPSFPEGGLSSSIECLIITECDLLEDRCRRDGGQDWMKIEHIPCIEIGDI
ncbi:hypothetical protein IFM89_021491 [Coptis chinensis]|uniref:Uncharacterized protein n=1 Tax=Coptis chinensis TaxID=261450 RepID=A0A835H7V0_9MAGN|nr:hypothetical protein IFM89_021491 [Coptis chinensis]